MKRTLKRKVEWKGQMVTVYFEYWPSIPATRIEPEEGPEINILSIVSGVGGKEIDVPLISDDGGDGEYEKLVKVLLDMVEEEEAMSTIAIEPWD